MRFYFLLDVNELSYCSIVLAQGLKSHGHEVDNDKNYWKTDVGAMSALERELLTPMDALELAASINGARGGWQIDQLPTFINWEAIARKTLDVLKDAGEGVSS